MDMTAEPSAVPEPLGSESEETQAAESEDAQFVALPIVKEAPRPEFRIAGETFLVEREGDVIYLRHPKWSLAGVGDTIFEAERDLRSDMTEMADVMSAMPLNTLDQDALDLLWYLLRVA